MYFRNKCSIYHVISLFQDLDVDFLIKMSRMINCMGVQLISSWQK